MEKSDGQNKSPHTWKEAARTYSNGDSMRKCIEKELQGPIGKRYYEILKEIKKIQGNAELSNRAEQAQEATALTQARAEYTGHDWYEWHTAHDVRVRASHKNMDKVLCRFSDPPSPEELVGEKSVGKCHPGVALGCRCYAAPVILWEEIEWPHRVYFDRKIEIMTKEQFAKKFHAENLDYWV